MPRLFHGTDFSTGTVLVGIPEQGGVDVVRGGGEFGRGFYTQSSKSNALTWAQNNPRTAETACVIEFRVDEQRYLRLAQKVLDQKSAKRLRQKLRRQRSTGTYTSGKDVVIGPLESNPSIQQQKFESESAQALLNGRHTQRSM